MNQSYNAFISYSHRKDSELAPSLERALEKFAKPIFKKRALDIFRDANDLSASPDLWGKIEEGLNKSEYFIFLGSKEAANSRWCKKEVEHWKAHKSMDNFLVVLTDGELVWDETRGDFDWSKTTAVPENLSGCFKNEPLYVDFKGKHEPEELTLENPDFKTKVVLLAATLHGKPVGDMVGEAARQHKRMLFIRNGVIAILVALLGLSSYQTIEAKKQTEIARDSSIAAQKQRDIAKLQTEIARDSSIAAQIQREIAECQTEIAVTEKNNAIRQEKIAIKERNIALANYLSFQAQREPSPNLSFLYAKTALDINRDSTNRSLAYQAYARNNLGRSILLNQNFNFQDEIGFLPGDNTFYTRGDVENMNEMFGFDKVPTIYFTKNGNKIPAIGDKYRIWDLSGKLLNELTEDEFLAMPNNRSNEKKSSLFLDSVKQENNTYNFTISKPSGEKYKEFEFGVPNATINEIRIAADGEKIISIWSDGIIRLWDIETLFLFTYNTGFIYLYKGEIKVALSSDGSKMLATTSGEIQLWNLKNKGLIKSVRLDENIDCVRFSKDSKKLHITSNGKALVWDLGHYRLNSFEGTSLDCDTDVISESRKKKYEKLGSYGPYNDPIVPVVFPSEKFMVVDGGTLEIYKNISKDKNRWQFSGPVKRIATPDIDSGWNRSFIFSKSEKFMLTCNCGWSEEGLEVFLYDLVVGELMMSFPVQKHPETSPYNFPRIAFSPDETKIIISFGNLITLWNRPQTLDEFINGNNVNDLEEEQKARIITPVIY